MITDCEYNSIIYNDDDLIQVSEIFAEPMQKLYDFKVKCENDKTDRTDERKMIIKNLMNYLIQCFGQKKKETVPFDEYDNENDDYILLEHNPEYITYINKDNFFVNNLARAIPFLLAHARSKIRICIINLQNTFDCDIIKCHTDSLLINKTITCDEIVDVDENYCIIDDQKFIDLLQSGNNYEKKIGNLKIEFLNKTI